MKLKKIASLALAGIMAVSMLAGCKDGGNSNNNGQGNGGDITPTSTYTATVLADTSNANRVMVAAPNSMLDGAVRYVAENFKSGLYNELTYLAKNKNSDLVAAGATYMGNAKYAAKDLGQDAYLAENGTRELLNGTKDVTYYAFYTIKRDYNDEMIDNKVSDLLDKIAAAQVGVMKDSAGNTRDYSVSVAKADLVNGKEADKSEDAVIVGIAVTMDYTEVTF